MQVIWTWLKLGLWCKHSKRAGLRHPKLHPTNNRHHSVLDTKMFCSHENTSWCSYKLKGFKKVSKYLQNLPCFTNCPKLFRAVFLRNLGLDLIPTYRQVVFKALIVNSAMTVLRWAWSPIESTLQFRRKLLYEYIHDFAMTIIEIQIIISLKK